MEGLPEGRLEPTRTRLRVAIFRLECRGHPRKTTLGNMAYVAGNARRAGLTDLPKAAPLILQQSPKKCAPACILKPTNSTTYRSARFPRWTYKAPGRSESAATMRRGPEVGGGSKNLKTRVEDTPLHRSAVHEAGHSTAAWRMQLGPIERVFIRDDGYGHTSYVRRFSGSLAMLVAMRRASSLVSRFAAERRPASSSK